MKYLNKQLPAESLYKTSQLANGGYISAMSRIELPRLFLNISSKHLS